MDHHTTGPAGCASFAYQSLTEIPYKTILAQADTLEVLDLSYNLLDDPYWNPALLGQLQKLSTLILDGNNYTSHIKFPYMPSVTTVCVNKNKISNLPVFVEEIRRKLPNLRILSMMNNEAAPSYFNGGSLTQYTDYRQYVVSQIPGLETLDDTEVLEGERVQARKTYQLQQSGHGGRKRKDTQTQRKSTSVLTQHRRLGSLDYGSLYYGSLYYGSSDYGSLDYDSLYYGSLDYGSLDYGSLDYGSLDYDSLYYGSSDYGSLDYDSSDYGSSDYGSSDYGSSDYGSPLVGLKSTEARDSLMLSKDKKIKRQPSNNN
ncbi:leucine-rich melanocyte differentiation-associated protein [Brachionichthys hirsutus]|uniref:leucine-rich melanocyte differentiation-associated protein n=1 Tax=Brachionichthys hirsutus TaxID=412623 RepID=UPI003604DCF6